MVTYNTIFVYFTSTHKITERNGKMRAAVAKKEIK